MLFLDMYCLYVSCSSRPQEDLGDPSQGEILLARHTNSFKLSGHLWAPTAMGPGPVTLLTPISSVMLVFISISTYEQKTNGKDGIWKRSMQAHI